MGVGKANSGGVPTDRPGGLRGSSGTGLRVDGKADHPATFLPPDVSLSLAPPSADACSGGEREGGGGGGGVAVSCGAEDPQSRGAGGRRAGGAKDAAFSSSK